MLIVSIFFIFVTNNINKSRISNGTLLINRYYSLNICRLRKKRVILLS